MDIINKYCVVRGDRSGIFAGTVTEINDRIVTIKNVRRLWYWDGAASISQIAQIGTVLPENCKFTVTVDEIVLFDTIEIIPCTKIAENIIKDVKEWKR